MNDWRVIEVCPYCGNPYGGRIGCCGESRAHGVWVVEDDLSGTTYETEEAAQQAAEEAQQ